MMGTGIMNAITEFYDRHRGILLDMATGGAVLFAVSLILHRHLFGFASTKSWLVNYGNF